MTLEINDTNALALEARWTRHPETIERLIDQVYRVGLHVCSRFYPYLLNHHYDDVLCTITSAVWETVEIYDPDLGDYLSTYYRYCLNRLRGLSTIVDEGNRFKEPRPSIVPISTFITRDDHGDDEVAQLAADQQVRMAPLEVCHACSSPPSKEGLSFGLCHRCSRRRKSAAKRTGTEGICDDCGVIYRPIYGDDYGRVVTHYACLSCGKNATLTGTRRDE